MLGWLLTHILVVVGAGLGWLYPFVGAMIYFAFAILRPEMLWYWSFDPAQSNRFSFLVAASTTAGWLMRGGPMLFARLRGARLPLLGLALYLAYGAVLTYTSAPFPQIAERELVLQAKIAFMVLVVVTIVRSEWQIKAFGLVILFSVGYLAYELNLDWVATHRLTRRFHLHGDNNFMALFMTSAVPFAFFFSLVMRAWWQRALFVMAAVLCTHVVLFSNSRGGMLGLLVACTLIFGYSLLFLPRKGMTILAAILAALVIWRLAGEQVVARFETLFAPPERRDGSIDERSELAKLGWKLFLEEPMGRGPRNTPQFMHEHGFPRGKVFHNLYLQVGNDWGAPALAGFLLFYLGTMAQLYQLMRRPHTTESAWLRYLAIGVFFSLFGFLFSGAFLSCENVEIGVILAAFGLCCVSYSLQQPDVASGDRPTSLPAGTPPSGRNLVRSRY